MIGLVRSISRRWMISKTLPPRERLGVFFGARDYRAKIWNQKRKKPSTGGIEPNVLSGAAEKHVDPDWYAAAHGLEDTGGARGHFAQHGLARGLAPAPQFADSHQKLPQWGLEYFARLGLPIGLGASQELLPGDPDAARAFALKNERRKPLAVVSANFGSDRLLPVDPTWGDTTDFFLISDRKFDDLGIWQPVHANYFHVDPRRRALFFKTHLPSYFSAYEKVMWIDGNVLLCRDPVRILRDQDIWDVDLATFRDGRHATLVSAAAACVELGKDDLRVVGAYLANSADHPAFESRNLFETMVMAMNPNSDAVRRMSAQWWACIMRGSKCDELSLPLAVHDAAGIDWRVFPEEQIKMSPNFVQIDR